LEPSTFSEIAKVVGIPGAMLVVFFILNLRGIVIWGRELKKVDETWIQILKFKDTVIDSRDEFIVKQEDEFKGRLEELRKEKNFWRQIALGGAEELERATRTIEKAVEKLPRSHTAPPPEGGY